MGRIGGNLPVVDAEGQIGEAEPRFRVDTNPAEASIWQARIEQKKRFGVPENTKRKLQGHFNHENKRYLFAYLIVEKCLVGAIAKFEFPNFVEHYSHWNILTEKRQSPTWR